MDTNENKGLIKTYWENIREQVSKVEPQFSKIVDQLSPDKSFLIYIAHYPYGSMESDTTSSFFPNPDGSFYRLTDSNAPKDITKHLGYSVKSCAPFGMVLDKQLEIFIDIKREKITIPLFIYTPGMFFPYARILSLNHPRVYAPNGILSSTAGVRSVFMLPKIGCVSNHQLLQRDLNIKTPTPKSMYEHWHVFREISDLYSNWRCCVIYFSEKWVTTLHSDPAWIPLKNYLHELAWKQFEYERNRIYYDITFSMIENHKNLKPNPYIVDTAKHLFATASGAAPGYVPALDEDGLPLSLIQEVYTGPYGLKKYYPTIMRPTHFIFEKDKLPIYYSFQHPSTYISSPKSRRFSTTVHQLLELEHIMRIFLQELAKTNQKCNDTILGEIAKNIEFNYYHSNPDKHRVVKNAEEIPKIDGRFLSIPNQFKKQSAGFACDASFLRGCISMRCKT